MKNPASIAAGLLTALAIAGGHAATTVTYSESFANTTGGDRPLSDIDNIHAYWGANATAYTLNSSASTTEPILSGATADGVAGYVFNFATNSAGTSSFIFLDSFNAGSASAFDSVQFSMRNEVVTGGENVRVTIQIGGDWYVTNTVYNHTSSGAFADLSTFGSTWSELNFDADTSMGIGSLATLPTTGTVTGVGIYDESRGNRIRFKNIEILSTIPEPSGAMLLGASGILALLRRRR